jgi:GTP cyclohydrolase II
LRLGGSRIDVPIGAEVEAPTDRRRPGIVALRLRRVLDQAFQAIAAEGCGAVVYLRGHEGRGIGLSHKIRAYAHPPRFNGFPRTEAADFSEEIILCARTATARSSDPRLPTFGGRRRTQLAGQPIPGRRSGSIRPGPGPLCIAAELIFGGRTANFVFESFALNRPLRRWRPRWPDTIRRWLPRWPQTARESRPPGR